LSQPKIVQETSKERDTVFLATYLEMQNASIIFFSEKEGKLGSLAVAIPQKRPPLSSILLGDRNVMVARLLAERLCKKKNKIALVSIFIKTVDEREVGPILLRLLEKTLKNREE